MDKSPSQLRKQADKARQLWGRTRDPYVRQMLAFLAKHWEAEAKSLEREDHGSMSESRTSSGQPSALVST
jgi:hypothetical protein